MVNSGDPSNNCASFQSYYNRRKASREPQPLSKQPVTRKDFPVTLTQRVDTLPGSSEPKLPAGAKISGSKSLTRLHVQAHASLLSLMRWHLRVRGSFFGCRTSPPESPVADLRAYVLGFLIQHLHHPLLSIFLSSGIYIQILFYFSSKSDTIEVPLTI